MEATTRRILVTLDGSALAASAIPVAAKLATALDAEVVLLRVVEGRWWGRPRGADLRPVKVEVEAEQAAAELRLHEAAFPGLPVTCVVLKGTYAAVEIMSWLRGQSCPVDFIVMATHGRGGLHRLVAGSVTEAVLRGGVAPVVVVSGPPRSLRTANVPDTPSLQPAPR
jgi:nucleotide-binding universal stress UspA family protein